MKTTFPITSVTKGQKFTLNDGGILTVDNIDHEGERHEGPHEEYVEYSVKYDDGTQQSDMFMDDFLAFLNENID